MGWRPQENQEKRTAVTIEEEKDKKRENHVKKLISEICHILETQNLSSSSYEHAVIGSLETNKSKPKVIIKVAEFDDGAKQSLWLSEDQKWYCRLYQRALYNRTEKQFAPPSYLKPEYVGSSVEELLRAFLDIKFGFFAESSAFLAEDRIGDYLYVFSGNVLQEIEALLEKIQSTLLSEAVN